MSRTDAKPVCQDVHRPSLSIEGAFFDQSQPTLGCGQGAIPGCTKWRRFRSATQARPESRSLRRGSGGIEAHIAGACRPHRTDRPAVDACRADSGEEPPIIRGITGNPCSFAFLYVEHRRSPSAPSGRGRRPIPASTAATAYPISGCIRGASGEIALASQADRFGGSRSDSTGRCTDNQR